MIRCPAALLTAVLLLGGCSPALNWREVRAGTTELKALLPCKPDQASRRQRLADHDVDVHMLGCEAEGAMFAVSYAELGPEVAIKTVQMQWQTNMLANMRAADSTRRTFSMRGADAQMQPIGLSATGFGPDGSPVAAQAVWFSRGSRLYHAAIYAQHINEEISEPFFSGLKFQ